LSPTKIGDGSSLRREQVRKTISRKDAKVQSIAIKAALTSFAPSAALRLCVKCYCSCRPLCVASHIKANGSAGGNYFRVT